MTLRLLGMGDPHLVSDSDLKGEFSEKINEIVDIYDVDSLVTVGDIIDSLPGNRDEREIDLGKTFFQAMASSGVSVDSIGGNHDYDIQEEITDVGGVNNLDHGMREFNKDGVSYSIIGRGATSFEQGPELFLEGINRYGKLDFSENYMNSNLDELVEDLEYVNEDVRYSTLEDYFDVEVEDKPDFRDSVDRFRDEYGQMEELFSIASGDQTIYMSHELPFNTDIDLNREDEHSGSLVDRHVLEEQEPDLYIGGHLHDGGIDYFETNSGTSTLVNLGRRQLGIMEMNGDGTPGYRALTEPDL